MHSLGPWSLKSLSTFAIIMFISVDGSSMAQETPAPPPVVNGKIAFVRRTNNTAGVLRIFVMDPDGSNQVRLGNSLVPTGDSCPMWSPDGRKIAFSGVPGYPHANICAMDADGSNQIFLTNNLDSTRDFFPAWSPDGSRIAFSRLVNFKGGGSATDNQWQIYLMDPDGSNQSRLTDTVEAANSDPKWSPDGTRIVFTRSFNNSGPAMRSAYSEIYVMNADGSNQMPLTTSPVHTVNLAPAWSPDNTTIAFF